MASGSSSDAAEPAEWAAAPAAAETEEDQVKRRRLQSLGFALVTSCDTTVASTFLSENNWQTEKALSAFFEQPENDLARPHQPPTSSKSEDYLPFATITSGSSTPLLKCNIV